MWEDNKTHSMSSDIENLSENFDPDDSSEESNYSSNKD